MTPQKVESRGGKRKGAGRKPKYGEKTITVSFRIPESKKEDVTRAVRKIINSEKTMIKSPTFKQQWVLAMSHENGLIYTGNLKTDSFAPFRVDTDSAMRAFLLRMERAGWIEQEQNPAFFRVTTKAKEWIKENPLKSKIDYDREYFKAR